MPKLRYGNITFLWMPKLRYGNKEKEGNQERKKKKNSSKICLIYKLKLIS